MKKNMVIAMIIGIIIGVSTTIYADYKYNANEVEYTPENSNFKVDNVEDAINKIYNDIHGPFYVAPSSDDTHKGIVYMDPTDLTKRCTYEAVKKNVNSNGKPTEIKTGCMKWYVYKINGNNYTMILDHNTTAHTPWSSESPMVEAIPALTNDTKDWKVEARMISAQEIVDIVGGVSTWNVNDYKTWFFFDSKNQTQTETSKGTDKYAWLFDYVIWCEGSGCNEEDDNLYEPRYDDEKLYRSYGYYTSTMITTYNSKKLYWTINSDGSLKNHYPWNLGAFGKGLYGIRPVVTIDKSIINFGN